MVAANFPNATGDGVEREDEWGGAGGPGHDGHPRHGDLQVLQGRQELQGQQQGAIGLIRAQLRIQFRIILYD